MVDALALLRGILLLEHIGESHRCLGHDADLGGKAKEVASGRESTVRVEAGELLFGRNVETVAKGEDEERIGRAVRCKGKGF